MQRFADNPDYLGTGAPTYHRFNAAASLLVSANALRGATAKGYAPTAQSAYASLTFDNQGTWYVAFRAIITAGNGQLAFDSNNTLVSFVDGGSKQLGLCVNGSGQLAFFRGTTQLPGIYGISFGTEYHFEIRAVLHNSAGEYELKINEVSRISQTGQDTCVTANNYASVIRFFDLGSVGNLSFSPRMTMGDLIINDPTGSVNNSWIGDKKALVILPNAAGDTQNWSVTGAASHHAALSEVPPSTSEYIHEATVSDDDLLNYPNQTGITSVAALHQVSLATKDDAGSRKFKHLLKYGGTVYVHPSTEHAPSQSTYAYMTSINELQPNSGAPFTAADIDNLQDGVRVTA